MIRLALAGDTMLGRRVGDRLVRESSEALVAPELVEVAREADRFVMNLECCLTAGGEPWPQSTKPYFFRGPPPQSLELLARLGVDCVTLGNNHALDFGSDGLLETLEHLRAAGIAAVGAGANVTEARTPAVLEHDGFRLAVVGATDHHRQFAAGRRTPGVAYAGLRSGLDRWVAPTVRAAAAAADAVLVTPHWGPNRATEPVSWVRRAAKELVAAGATLVAGHSAHVFQGVSGRVLFDLGDFLDDFRVHVEVRNDLGLFWLVDLDADGPTRLEAVPIDVQFCRTGLARGTKAEWIRHRFTTACAAFGTEVREEDGRLIVEW